VRPSRHTRKFLDHRLRGIEFDRALDSEIQNLADAPAELKNRDKDIGIDDPSPDQLDSDGLIVYHGAVKLLPAAICRHGHRPQPCRQRQNGDRVT